MRFRLRMFGGLALVGTATSESLGATRRKPLALLAVLAVAGELGVTRDKIASLLWPEGEQEKVRGVLKQTLYSIRQELEADDIVTGNQDLRLNPERVETDLWDFERALNDGRLEDAAGHYTGPFLDGVHLNDAPGFEHWVDTQRDRLARRFARAMEMLALAAMGRNQPRAAAEWWLRVTEHDPYDVRAVSGLLHACLADGDRPRAIRYAERHMSLLRKELEITPDPEIRRLVEQARARPQGGA
ncbi:MAG: BTAD domain-containing putative transcriptional regulator [Gemmatimonadales bacterium]